MATLFSRTSQTDVVAVLMLLGEATMWRALWERLRARHGHWRQWVFAVSPGWAPLAATLFTALSSATGPGGTTPNLVYDRPPEGVLEPDLVLTNLNSGASHNAASAVALQSIWDTWRRGPRQQSSGGRRGQQEVDTTREVGVVDLDLGHFALESGWTFWAQAACLAAQILVSFVAGFFRYGFEPFIVVCMALVGQTLLIVSVTPGSKSWYTFFRRHRGCAAMLHRGLNSKEVLIIRKATLHGREVNLEEYAWNDRPARTLGDTVRLYAASAAFIVLALQIILVSWMSEEGRNLYLILGSLGLGANALQAASPPNWTRSFHRAFSGTPRCAPANSCLLGAVGILVAGGFPAARDAAQELYPANQRFQETLAQLGSLLIGTVCDGCRLAIRQGCSDPHRRVLCARALDGSAPGEDCARTLVSRVPTSDSKQQADALVTVAQFLCSLKSDGRVQPVDLVQMYKDASFHKWESSFEEDDWIA